jgi:molybdopterin molybdotransferase
MDAGPEFETRVADWLGVSEARARVLEAGRSARTPRERVDLAASLGRALAEDLRATATLPPWSNSAMDGYAVRSRDLEGASAGAPVTLRVTGRLRAGDVPAGPVRPGETIRIMTGAPVPDGADAVVRREDTDGEAQPGLVRIFNDRDRGRHVRPRGEDMRPGDLVLGSGTTVTPGVVGVLAGLGHAAVWVRRRPTVAILATGDELRGPERYEDVRRGLGVPDSNAPMAGAQAMAAGATPLLLGCVPDRPEELAAAVAGAADADVLITLGGASMGEADLVKRVLDAAGFRLDFWRVRMRPGSPFSFGWLDTPRGPQAVFGLPGNPSSAFVTFELFARPFLLAMAGHRRVFRRVLPCRIGGELRGAEGLTVFARVSLDPSTRPPTAVVTGPQGSGLVRGLGVAQGLAVVPEGRDLRGDDGLVDVILLDDGPGLEEAGTPEAPGA